jgi:hypothetical protein
MNRTVNATADRVFAPVEPFARRVIDATTSLVVTAIALAVAAAIVSGVTATAWWLVFTKPLTGIAVGLFAIVALLAVLVLRRA